MRFSNFDIIHRTRKGKVLNQVDHLLDWNPIEKAINLHYSPKSDVTGRPFYPGLLLSKNVAGYYLAWRSQRRSGVVNDRKERGNESSAKAAMQIFEVTQPGVDTKARWVKMGGKSVFGYKQHTIVGDNGLVMAVETTAANQHDNMAT